MTFAARRATYVAALLACMVLAGWAGTYQLWRWVAGDDVGTALAVFWDLQVESYVNVLTLALALDLTLGLHRGPEGWAFAPRRRTARLATYGVLAALALVCAAEGPLRDVLALPLPDDIARSVAHYARRGLEGVLATMGVLVFLDLVRPAGLTPLWSSPRREPTAAAG
ncbi:hypothetical protein PO878_07385 [Iamia majanohamensis]|uniref:Uncharacterized protein n=1 Tax=Iamia majanohamensis TaxID=467976 RepID=A0AAE9YCJ2_9ACTN|nr:hypothetical protein [Iamia majanohamensis]WCO68549.1 hypothetical protein PO878_07385 [Iamia majanohamensis]